MLRWAESCPNGDWLGGVVHVVRGGGSILALIGKKGGGHAKEGLFFGFIFG